MSCHNLAIWNFDGDFHINKYEDAPEISSMTDELAYKHEISKEKVNCLRLETFIDNNQIDIHDYDMVNIDIAGFSSYYKIIESFGKYLNDIKYISYKKMAGFADSYIFIDQDDRFLNNNGFYVNKECYNSKKDDYPSDSYFWINQKIYLEEKVSNA